MKNIAGAAIGLALGAMMLTACTGEVEPAPTPTPTPAAEPTATPSTEPTDPLDGVTGIVVRATALDLVDETDAVVETLSFDLPAEEIVESLSTVFDSSPVLSEGGQCCETPLTTKYAWPGFEIWDDHVGNWDEADRTVWVDGTGADERDMNVIVVATVADLGGVALSTEPGFQTDSDPATVAAAVGRDYRPGDFAEFPLEYGPDLGESVIEGERNAYAVTLQIGSNGPRIIAPVHLGVGRV